MAFQEASKKTQRRLVRNMREVPRDIPENLSYTQQRKNLEAAFNQLLKEKQDIEDKLLDPLKMKLNALTMQISKVKKLEKESDRDLGHYILDVIRESVSQEQWKEWSDKGKERKARIGNNQDAS